MDRLPAASVQPSRFFTDTDLYYAGSFYFNASPGRGTKTMIDYVCLFVCLATKAAYLELVSDCFTSTFLTAFRRLVSL